MFTILIPVLKPGFLQSQLFWLSKQTHREFTVVAMDSFHAQTRYQPWAVQKYPFVFHHLPLIHNIGFPKTHDYSVKNNLALLAPTNHFIFLSDTHYPTIMFAERVADHVLHGRTAFFTATTVLYTAYDQNRHLVDLGGQTTHISRPATLYDRKLFFYILNGFDEATTYCPSGEFIVERTSNACQSGVVEDGHLFHILHDPAANDFGRRWKVPCEKCSDLFPAWRFNMATETGEFPLGKDVELYTPFMFRDPLLGIPMFQCPNCGYGGCCNPAVHRDLVLREHLVEAAASALDGRTGRDLSSVYEVMNKQVNNDMQARIAYLKTTY